MDDAAARVDAIEALMTTRAIRRYTSQPVSDADIETCLRAAQQAPSGGNVQPQQYVVVSDAALRSELGRLYRESFDRYEATLPDIDDDPALFGETAAAAVAALTIAVIEVWLREPAPRDRALLARRWNKLLPAWWPRLS